MFESISQCQNDFDYQETNSNNHNYLNQRLTFQPRHIDQKVIASNRNYFKEIKKKNQLKLEEANFKNKFDHVFWIIIHIVSNIFNVLNVMVYIAQTYTEKYDSILGIKVNNVLDYCDIIFASYFIFEYMIMCYKDKNIPFLKRLFSFDTLIVLGTIVPSILLFIITHRTFRLYLRAIAIFRILRIYKSLKILQSDSNVDLGKNLSKIKLQFILIIITFISLFLISTCLILSLQDLLIDSFNRKDLSFMDALFFVVVTATTLGYGDIYPSNIVSRIYIIILIMTFIYVISYQITQLIQLVQLIGNSAKYEIENHAILIMEKNIDFNLVLREIKKVDHRKQVIIITRDKEVLPSNEYPFNKVILIQSEEINFEILQQVNTKRADYIIVFANASLQNWEQTEKINEFIVLKIMQYYSNIPIYVQSLFNDKSFLCEISQKKESMFPFIDDIAFNDDEALNESKMIIKCIVPIFKIKSLIMGKAMFNPGFANFAQNLLFNDSKIQFDIEGFDRPMQAHFLGCENTILINELPRSFVGLDFFDAMRMIYAESVRDYLTKANVNNIKEVNRPVILIGINDRSNRILLYPKEYIIHRNTLGIFISYDGDKYIDTVLQRVKIQQTILNNKDNDASFQEERFRRQKTQKRLGFSERPTVNSIKAFNSQLSFDLRRSKKGSEENCDSSNDEEDVDANLIHEVNQLISSKKRTDSFEDEENRHEDNSAKNHNNIVDIMIPRLNSTNLFDPPEEKDKSNTEHRRSMNINLESQLKFMGENSVQLTLQKNNITEKDKENNKFPKIQSDFIRTKTFETNDYDQKKIETKIAKTMNQAEVIEKQMERASKEKDINFFLAKKNQILKGKNNKNNDATTKNLLFIESFNEHNLNTFLYELNQTIQRRYQCESVINKGFVLDNKQFDCAKDDISTILANHILIIGYQEGFDKLLQIIKLHYPYKDICIMTSYSIDDSLIIKYIKEYKCLYHLKGEIDNPFHLNNAGIVKASYVIFLIEQIYGKANEDIEKILGFRALDYFYKTSMLLEIWDHLSISFLGYNPVINQSIIANELLHPLYMAGKVIYLDHFSRIVCMNARNSIRIEAWYELMNVGYRSKVTTSGEGYISVKRVRGGYPVIISIDLPEKYIGKDFFSVVTDLMCQRKPSMILGIYIDSPLNVLETKREISHQLNIISNHRKKLPNVSVLHKKEQDSLVNLTLLKNISCNDKIVIDYTDLNHSSLSMFITNPPPWYVLTKGTKLLLLNYYEPPHQNNLAMFQKELANNYSRRSGMNGSNYFGSGTNQKSKIQLGFRQDNFYQTLATFKDKISEKYQNEYKKLDR